MAKVKYLIKGITLVVLMAGCNRELINPERNYTGTKEMHLTYSNETQSQILKIETTASINLLVKSTKRYDKDITLQLKLEGIEGVSLSPSTITIPQGEVKAEQEVKIKAEKRVEERMEGIITLTDLPEETVVKKKVSLIIDPLDNLAPSDEDRKLLAYWKEHFGMDLLPFIGKLLCNGTVDENGEDLLDFFMKPRHINITNQEMIVAVSKMATEEQPILSFTSNALGLTSYWKEVWLALTWNNREYWNDPDNIYVAPAAKIIIKALQWTEETPIEFDVAMPIVRIDTQNKGNVLFTGTKVEAVTGLTPNKDHTLEKLEKLAQSKDPVFELYYDRKNVDNAIQFKVPLFEKAVELSKDDPELYTAIREGSFSPFQMMDTKTIGEDTWKDDIEVTHYEEPKGKIDFERKEIHIRTISSLENSGYTVIDITCKVMP